MRGRASPLAPGAGRLGWLLLLLAAVLLGPSVQGAVTTTLDPGVTYFDAMHLTGSDHLIFSSSSGNASDTTWANTPDVDAQIILSGNSILELSGITFNGNGSIVLQDSATLILNNVVVPAYEGNLAYSLVFLNGSSQGVEIVMEEVLIVSQGTRTIFYVANGAAGTATLTGLTYRSNQGPLLKLSSSSFNLTIEDSLFEQNSGLVLYDIQDFNNITIDVSHTVFTNMNSTLGLARRPNPETHPFDISFSNVQFTHLSTPDMDLSSFTFTSMPVKLTMTDVTISDCFISNIFLPSSTKKTAFIGLERNEGDTIKSGVTLTFTRCLVTRNTFYRGMVFIEFHNAHLEFIDSELSFNTGILETCGIYFFSRADGSYLIQDSRFLNNTSSGGAVIQAYSGQGLDTTLTSSIVKNCTFFGNLGTANIQSGSNPYSSAISFFYASTSYLEITDSSFISNRNTYFSSRGPIFLGKIDFPSVIIRNVNFTRNEGQFAGVICADTNLVRLTMENVRAIGNTARAAGGVVQCFRCTILGNVTDSHFEGNVGTDGGVFYIGNGHAVSPSLSFRNVKFINNSGRGGSGGALFAAGTNATVEHRDCAFEGNTAGFGGAIYFADGHFSLSLKGNTYFARNKATASGGTGGAIYIFKNFLPVTISNMVFTGNTAAKGGAIYVASPSQSHIYTNITVKDCVGGLEGGGIWIEGTTLTLTDSYFEGNSAGTGAALFFRGANFGTSNLSRLTFRSHKSDQGTVAFSGGTRKIALSDIELTNNNDAFYATGTFAADLSLSRWTIQDNSNLKVDLSGIGRSLFMFSGFQGRFILENSRVYNSSYPVGSLFSVDSSAGDTIVSNVTFENNRAPALHAQNRASVVISNCTFANNTAVVQDNPVILNFFGLTQNAKATISDSTFVDNRAGSLLTHSSGAGSTISNSRFTNNAIFTSLFASSSGSLILSSAQVEQPVVAQPGSCISLTTFGNITILDSEFSNCASSTGPALASVRDRSTMVVYNTSFSNVHTSQGPAFKLSDASTLTMDGSRFSQIHTGAVSLAGYALEASIKNTVFESSDSSSLSPIYLRVSEGARLHLEGSTFSDGTSQSSPCIYVDSASLNMTDCTLSGCSSGGQGGALTLFGSTVFEAINTTFTGNSALSGGALSFIQLSEALVTFTDCSFVENSAEGGGVLTSAVSTGNVILFKNSVFQSNTANTFGGVFLGTDYTQMTFEDCLFEDNNAETAGIGYLDWNAVVHFLSSSAEENRASDRGGAFYLEKLSKLILKDSSFTSSTAGNETTVSAGGLIFMTSKAHLKVHRSTIKKCYTYGNGGAIYVNPENQCTMEIVDSKFDGNQALRLRAVEPDQEPAPTYGGAIYFNAISTAAFVVNTTAFEQSTADYGGAISSQSIYFPFLNENTFVDNQASIFGPDIFSPPDGTTLSLESFELLSGEPIPTFSLELLDHFGQRYILPPSPTITILVSLREIQTFGPGQAYLKGQTAGTFTNGTLEFSSSDARIRVYGPEGQYRLSVAPIPSDVYFKDADYIHEVIVTIKPCSGTNSMVLDLSCQPIQCLDCTFGECVSPNNCSCNAGWEGLGCNAPKDGYDNIKLRMKELPRLPTQAKRDGSTGITVEMRTYLINQVAASLDGMNVTVVYRAFYQEGDYYVFKYSLTDQAGMYIEGSQLDQYSSVTTEYFATELNAAGASADLNAAAAKHLTLGDPLVVVVLVLVLLMLAITTFTLVVVWFKRNTPIIRSASPLFCMIILVGLILAYLTIIPYIGEPTRVSCMAPVVLGPLAFSVVYGNLLAKTFRIYRIFSNRKMRAVAPTNKMLLGFSGVVVAIEMILVAAWLIADAPVPINAGPAEHRFRSCHSDLNTTMSSIILAYNGVLLLFGTYLAVRTRNAFSAFKESQMIGFSIYSLTIFAIAVLPVLYAVDLLLEVQFAIRSFAILLVTTITLALLYGSKMMIIFFQPSKNTQDYFDQQMQKRSSSLPGFNMKNVGASARPTGSGSQINNSYEFQNLMTRASGYLLVLDNKPWSRWKKMFFVQYGEYFGFFDDEAAVDYHGGMYPIANWEVYRFSDSKMQIKYGSKTWSVDARDPQELDKWFDILTPSNRRSSMRHSTSDVIKIPAGAPSQE